MLLICSVCVVIATSSHAPSVRAVSDALVGRSSEYLRLDDVKKALNIGMLMMRDDVFLSHDGEDVVELMHKCIGSADRLTSIRTFLDRNRFEVDAALATMLISTSETSLILHSTRSDMDALRTFVQPLISVMAHYSHGILHRCMYEFLPSELRDESKYNEMFTPVSSETHPVVPGDRDYILARLPNEDFSDGLIGINFMGKVLRMSFPADKPERLVDLKTGCMVKLNPSYHNLYLDPNSRSMFVEDVAGDIHVWYGGSKEVTIPRHVFEDKHAMNIHSSHFDFTADAEQTFFKLNRNTIAFSWYSISENLYGRKLDLFQNPQRPFDIRWKLAVALVDGEGSVIVDGSNIRLIKNYRAESRELMRLCSKLKGDLNPLQQALLTLMDVIIADSLAPMTLDEIGAMHAVRTLGAAIRDDWSGRELITEPFRFVQHVVRGTV